MGAGGSDGGMGATNFREVVRSGGECPAELCLDYVLTLRKEEEGSTRGIFSSSASNSHYSSPKLTRRAPTAASSFDHVTGPNRSRTHSSVSI